MKEKLNSIILKYKNTKSLSYKNIKFYLKDDLELLYYIIDIKENMMFSSSWYECLLFITNIKQFNNEFNIFIKVKFEYLKNNDFCLKSTNGITKIITNKYK